MQDTADWEDENPEEFEAQREAAIKRIVEHVVDHAIAGTSTRMPGGNPALSLLFKEFCAANSDKPEWWQIARKTANASLHALFDLIEDEMGEAEILIVFKDKKGRYRPLNQGMEWEMKLGLFGDDDDPGWIRKYSEHGCFADEEAAFREHDPERYINKDP